MTAGAPGGGGFGETRWSVVLRARGAPTDTSRKALAELCRDYQGPLRAFARRFEPDPERAEELVQDFLVYVIEKDTLSKADPERGRFRSFLRTALRHHAQNVWRTAGAKKRGGHVAFLDAEGEAIEADDPGADHLHDRLWARALLDRALARLAEEHERAGSIARFVALRGKLSGDHDSRSLKELAAELGTTEGAVKVALYRMRRRFSALVHAEVAATVARFEDVHAELTDLRDAFAEEGDAP